MGWRTSVFGEENPSRERQVWIGLFTASLGIAVYGICTDFVPNPVWQSNGTDIAAVLAVIFTLVFFVSWATGRLRLKANFSGLSKWGSILCLPLMLYGLAWLVVIRGAGDLYSRWVGRSTQIEMVLAKEHFRSRRACNYQLVGPALGTGLANYLCVNANQFHSLPGSAPYRLDGRISSLGFHIDDVWTSRGERINSPLDAILQ